MRGPTPGTVKDQSALDQAAALRPAPLLRAGLGPPLSVLVPQGSRPESLSAWPPQTPSCLSMEAHGSRPPAPGWLCDLRKLLDPSEFQFPTYRVRERTTHFTGLWSRLRPHCYLAQPVTLGSVRRKKRLLCLNSLTISTGSEF